MNFLNKYLFIFCITLFTVPFVFSQNHKKTFVYKSVPQTTIDRYYSPSNLISNYNNAIYVDQYLKGNESVSERTKIIQRILNENSIVVLPNKSIVVLQVGLELKSNSTLIFQSDSELIIADNSLERYELLRVHNVQNVKIYNANLKGDRKSHKSSKGEWGYGISIRNSSDIRVENFKIQNFWGDGIVIGTGTTSTNKNIILRNGVIDYSRRNGISVINVDGLLLENIHIANTYGTLPMFGIDFEPNNSLDNLNNIRMLNVETFNNAYGGLMITFNKLKAKNRKNIRFEVLNYKDKGSYEGILIAGVPKEAPGLRGNLTFNNIILEDNTRPIIGRTINNKNVLVKFENLNIIKPRNKNVTHSEVKRVFDSKKNYIIRFKD